ncbi:PREDICTED: uncharacterized protein LOC104600962 [Nelumbo nucifera]|uniref:Uncharacterized protein n=2 Tax=Nelumbo nucifera TaxID=4432 RepID=A0A822Z1J1_NELNU|nr:PREDICTED: uncharacterized protein LOC104600962 [Nelumbo nucifera]DAD36866.1 TPA_asm: hypothetical protein HUJ06_007507 [Nelumbo nucifera]
MDQTSANPRKDEHGKEEFPFTHEKDMKLVVENSNSEFTEPNHKRSLERLKPDQMLTSGIKQSHTGERCIHESFFQSQLSTDVKILKQMHFGSLKEIHVRHGLDFADVRESKPLSVACHSVPPCNIAVNLSSSKMEILFDALSPVKSTRRNGSDWGSFIIECPSAAEQGNLVISSVGQWIVGAISGNTKISGILKSPLLYNLGALNHDINLEKVGSTGVKGKKYSGFMRSPSRLSINLSQNLERGVVLHGNEKYESGAIHKTPESVSCSNSACSNQSSPSTCSTLSQGRLHCIWKNGVPYFVFSVDDQREVYVANMWKVESSDDKALDYMYTFHSRTGGQEKQGDSNNVSDIVGKMKVSSSFSLCSNDLKLTETEFVLFGTSENHLGEMPSSTPIRKNNSRLPKKVVNDFRTINTTKNWSIPGFGVPSSMLEDLSSEPYQDMFRNLDAPSRINLLEGHLLPNLELAAIVVRSYVHDDCQDTTVGGWGLKFLNKVEAQQNNTFLEATVSSEDGQESLLQNENDCSTSIDVLVPAGIHDGPRTRIGGPSSLSERWRSGGHCDCGGWDIGCPLTVLNCRPTKEVSHRPDAKEECKTLNLFIKGSKQGAPTLRMVNIHDGLYFIHFQSTLSALQSFSVGVAIIHSQSPNLSPKMYK